MAYNKSPAPHTLNTHTSATAQEARLESARVAATASMPATKSPYAAGTAKAAGKEAETRGGNRKLSPMLRRNMWGATKGSSASRRSIVRRRGETKRFAATPEATKLISALSPNRAGTFMEKSSWRAGSLFVRCTGGSLCYKRRGGFEEGELVVGTFEGGGLLEFGRQPPAVAAPQAGGGAEDTRPAP